MAKQSKRTPKESSKKESSSDGLSSWKPGSETERAKDVGGDRDFGAPAGEADPQTRNYVSQNTRRSDRGATQPAGWEHDGVRDHGAGAADSGPGSGSAGDVDTDFTGVGTGGSTIAASGQIRTPAGPDDSDGSSAEFAAGKPAQGRNQSGIGKVGGLKRVPGDVQTRGQDQHTNEAEGADDITNPAARGDDSFAGEVSSGEARGEDNTRADGGADDLA